MSVDFSKEPVRVTDHCVLRYLERVMGLNVELVRDHILTICSGPVSFGAVCVRAEGFRFEIAGAAVVTVAPDGQRPSNVSRERTQERIAREARA